MRAVYADMLTLHDSLLEVEGRHATEQELLLVHTPEYLERLQGWVAEAAERGRPFEVESGLVVSDASWDAARAAVGSVLTGIETVLEGSVRNAFCAVRPPGADATANGPGGFSLLNSVAIAAKYLVRNHDIPSVAILEWRGRPTPSALPEILADDPGIEVVTVAPSRSHHTIFASSSDEHLGGQVPDVAKEDREGAAEVLDHGIDARRLKQDTAGSGSGEFRLPIGASGREFISALRSALASLTDSQPAFLLVAAGFDVLATDPAGELALTPADVYEASVEVRKWADEVCGGRLVSVLEGGYDVKGLGEATVQHLRALASLERAG